MKKLLLMLVLGMAGTAMGQATKRNKPHPDFSTMCTNKGCTSSVIWRWSTQDATTGDYVECYYEGYAISDYSTIASNKCHVLPGHRKPSNLRTTTKPGRTYYAGLSAISQTFASDYWEVNLDP